MTTETKRTWNEEEAIRQAKAGSASAFELLYKAHSRNVYGICLRMLRNNAEAEDLTQQAFLQLFRKIGSFRGESGFSTWLHRVTVNVVLMHLRRKKIVEVLVDDVEQCTAPAEGSGHHAFGDTTMLGAVDRLHLFRAIRKLPAGYKRLFVMHDVIGYQHNEIAEILGCSLGCSKSQLHRARKQLRRLLQGEQGTQVPA